MFQIVTEIQAKNVKIWIRGHGQKLKQAELLFLNATLRMDLFYNPTKYHLNILNGCRVMLRKQNVDARPSALLFAHPVTFII